MIQLTGKIDGGFPFSAVTNGGLCSVGVGGATITASVAGFAWVVKLGGPYEVARKFTGKASFSWPNPARQWQAKQTGGQTCDVTTGADGFAVAFDFVVPAGQAAAMSGAFGLLGDADFDGDVDAADLAAALGAGVSGEDLARILGNWG